MQNKARDNRRVVKSRLAMKMAVIAVIGFFLSSVQPVVSVSQENEEISAPNELNLVLEGNRLKIDLRLTGAETVGFVNAPLSRDEKSTVDDALHQLGDVRRLFAFPQVAGCAIDYFETAADTGPMSEENLTLRANYRFRCNSPRSLTRLKLLCFEKFEDLSAMKASLKGHWGEITTLVTPANPLLQFK